MPCLTGKLAVRVKLNVTVMIITFIMFLHKQRILSAFIFLFVPLVLWLLCVYYIMIRMWCGNVFVVVPVTISGIS